MNTIQGKDQLAVAPMGSRPPASGQDSTGTVRVYKVAANWSDLAWGTLSRFGVPGDSPGTDGDIEVWFRALLIGAREFGSVYANPAYTVVARTPTQEFIRQARRAQALWIRRCRSIFVSSGQLKRTMRRRPPLLRQLEFTGFLIIDGRHIHPQQWPTGQD